MAHALRQTDLRRAPRDVVSFRTDLVTAAGQAWSGFVVDISPLGLMARTPALLTPGEAVTVWLPAVDRCVGQVKWALGGRAGIEFDEAIPPLLYARLLAFAPEETPRWDER